MNELILSERMPVLAMRGLVLFPQATMHFDVGREKSVRALEAAMNADQHIFLVTQKEIEQDDPGFGDLYEIGTVAHVLQVLKIPGDTVRVLVQGEYRARATQMLQTAPCMMARVESIPEEETPSITPRTEALLRQAIELFGEYAELSQRPMQDIMLHLLSEKDPGSAADMTAQAASYDYKEKMRVLSQLAPVRRLETANRLLARELEVLRLEAQLQEKTQQSIDKGQRDYYLREQLKVIRGELGENDEDAEIDEYREKIEKLHLPQEADEKLHKELQRLEKQPYGSAEASVIRNYLDVALELPWNTRTRERTDIRVARRILDEDHFGLEKVKERILEILAVRQLAPEQPGQIICLIGPPGVGKTSIAMSVARALNRKLARISLGGVHDEAEIRGHRKTYIGAMPGRIIEAITRSGSMNPLLVLDEVDKLSSDGRGDPASALLEVLDSEQNYAFRDHYLEIPVDLSRVMFIMTANTLDTIPRPLLDRMEVIRLTSYTDEEKLQIAKNHLLPKQLKEHGLRKTQLRISDEALCAVIAGYTCESGVRQLERLLGKLCRKTAMALVTTDVKSLTVTPGGLHDLLGPARYEDAVHSTNDQVGVVNGLAWTEVGGEILEVEANVMPGSGKLELTGNLGTVMQESAKAALSCLRSRCDSLGIEPDFYKTKDIHIHFPEGAVPKDGPSAGIAITTAVLSALTGRRVRGTVAMTGEVTLRGRVLAIGGLKEKTMAALRNGVRTVIIPKANVKDLEEIDQTVRAALHFVPVETVDAVFEAALLPREAAAAVEHMTALPIPEYQEVRHGDQL